MAESRFLEAPLVRQADGELKNIWIRKIRMFFEINEACVKCGTHKLHNANLITPKS